MDQVEANETIYTYNKDEQRSQVTNIKFKTTHDRIGKWIRAHRELFPDTECWDDKNTCTTLKIKYHPNGNLIVKFHQPTGVVLI